MYARTIISDMCKRNKRWSAWKNTSILRRLVWQLLVGSCTLIKEDFMKRKK